MIENDTIAAVASGVGGAVTLIRVSGGEAIAAGDRIFRGVRGRRLADARGFTILYGTIRDGETVVDEVLVSVFRAPHSYTGEDMIEVSCHASAYIQREVMRLLVESGVRTAQPGEFTLRAFLAGKMDLSQAEAVADMIAADNRAAHALAYEQMRGGYSDEFGQLRGRLLELVSLVELELDFGEEDVEFADRTQLLDVLSSVGQRVDRLIASFGLGNVLKNGVPVAIVGVPNVGKSTLLNTLLCEEKALVSDIAGTTRDVIEDTLNIDGVTFRFIDTAGIRRTDDPLESLGIERTFDRIGRASVILLLTDARDSVDDIYAQYASLSFKEGQRIALILNKCDTLPDEELRQKRERLSSKIPHLVLPLSAKRQINLDELTGFLKRSVDSKTLNGDRIVVFNSRHHEILLRAHEALQRAREGIESGLAGDLLAQDIREVLHCIGLITGEITTDDILSSIFSKFCIGK